MLRSIGLPEILIIVGIVVLIFGIGRISKLGGELGKGIRAFREGISAKDDEAQTKEDGEEKNAS
ncbi:MAG: preprotein translocase subunit TatA [Gammaproteobacteria bacterium RBG_16_66_13]|nr:MAG: preprotein translocase subunit TatA [Gammaproteobacteria bacterium RBG_16_66_13]